jgi:hypothetical protein
MSHPTLPNPPSQASQALRRPAPDAPPQAPGPVSPTSFLESLSDPALREVARIALDAEPTRTIVGVLDDELREELSLACTRTAPSDRSLTEWFYLAAHHNPREPLDSPQHGRHRYFADEAENGRTFAVALVRVPRVPQGPAAKPTGDDTLTVTFPRPRRARRPVSRTFTRFVPAELDVAQALYLFNRYPLCFVQTAR